MSLITILSVPSVFQTQASTRACLSIDSGVGNEQAIGGTHTHIRINLWIGVPVLCIMMSITRQSHNNKNAKKIFTIVHNTKYFCYYCRTKDQNWHSRVQVLELITGNDSGGAGGGEKEGGELHSEHKHPHQTHELTNTHTHTHMKLIETGST